MASGRSGRRKRPDRVAEDKGRLTSNEANMDIKKGRNERSGANGQPTEWNTQGRYCRPKKFSNFNLYATDDKRKMLMHNGKSRNGSSRRRRYDMDSTRRRQMPLWTRLSYTASYRYVNWLRPGEC